MLLDRLIHQWDINGRSADQAIRSKRPWEGITVEVTKQQTPFL